MRFNIELNNIKPFNISLASIDNPKTIWNTQTELIQNNQYQVIASSCSGKSTFLKILNGTSFNYKGEVKVGNILLDIYQPDELLKIRRTLIHTVFQGLKLFDELTVWENLLLACDNKKDQNIARDLIKKFSIHDKIDVAINKISYGQKQRVAIIRALLGSFEWILLDEPFSHLDDKLSELILQEIIEISKNQKAGLIITALNSNASLPGFKSILI